MEEFIERYCSEPRLALNRAVVPRYRLQLEAKELAASTVAVRLAAVRRLAYEAADTGLLSPELVAGIRRVKLSQKERISIGGARIRCAVSEDSIRKESRRIRGHPTLLD